jgi:hypothetical protein
MANPYSPPHADVQRSDLPAHAPGRAVTALFGAAVAGTAACYAIALVVHDGRVSQIARLAINVFDDARVILAMAWLYVAWKGIPESHRGTMSPRRAALSLLYPFYNAYFGIAVNLALCDTLDHILARSRSPLRAPRVLAMTAAAVWLVSFVANAAIRTSGYAGGAPIPLVTIVVGGGLWLAYAIQCDRARDEVARFLAHGGDPGAARLSQLQRQRGPGVLGWFGLLLLVVMGLACWQLLAPAERPPVRVEPPGSPAHSS